MSPYRTPAEVDASDEESECPDVDLLPVFALVWVGSVVRVVMGLADHGGFGTEASLALAAVVLLPCRLRGPVAWWVARRRRRLARRWSRR